MMTLYGIPNCDTIKKARRWLDEHGLNYQFHDYRKDGVERDFLITCCEKFGFDRVLNRRGTTWRKLPDDSKRNLDQDKAVELMMDNPALIKRPILRSNEQFLLGFDQSRYQSLL